MDVPAPAQLLDWAGMAAIASSEPRAARSVPGYHLDTDRTGYVNLPRSLGRHKWLLMEDVNAIRETNNGIFDDIFWAHLAYASADDGMACLRGLLQGDGRRMRRPRGLRGDRPRTSCSRGRDQLSRKIGAQPRS